MTLISRQNLFLFLAAIYCELFWYFVFKILVVFLLIRDVCVWCFFFAGEQMVSITGITTWFEKCSLYIKWNSTDWNVSCPQYLISVYENKREMMSIFTKGTQHVYTGVKSAIVYDVKIKPTCEASHERFKRNISAWPGKCNTCIFPYLQVYKLYVQYNYNIF